MPDLPFRPMLIATSVVLLLAAGPGALNGQWIAPSPEATAAWVDEPDGLAMAAPPMATTGFVGGSETGRQAPAQSVLRTAGGATLGWLAGAVVGYTLGQAIEEEEFDPGYWVAGLLTAPVGAAVGAHLANAREGSLLLTSLASVGASLAIVSIANPLNVAGFYERNPAAAVGIAFGVQVGTATAVQLWSAGR